MELAGEVSTDVAVVGGGFCGLSCALHLARLGVDVALLEAENFGWGASGRNGGQVIPCFKENPEAVVSKLGSDLGERMNALGASGGRLVAELVDRYSIDCAFRRDGWILGIHSRKLLGVMSARARQWQERGRHVEVLDGEETARRLGTSAYVAGYLDPEGGALNPYSFANGLAAAAMREGAKVFARSRALSLARNGESWEIRTTQGCVKARKVVIATGAYSDGLLGGVKQSVLPVQSIQIATAPLPNDLRQRILPAGEVASDGRRLLTYFRLQEDGRFVFGGRGAVGGHSIAPSDISALVDAMHERFPDLRSIAVEYAWGGLVDITVDRTLRIHRPDADLTVVLGFNGRGVSIAPLVGREIATAIAGDSFDQLPLPVTPMRPIRLHWLRKPAMRIVAGWYGILDRAGY